MNNSQQESKHRKVETTTPIVERGSQVETSILGKSPRSIAIGDSK